MTTRHAAALSFLIVLVIGIGIAGFFLLRSTRSALVPDSAVDTPARSQEEIRAEWRQKAQAVVDQYRQDQNAERARDGMVALTVASADRETHLALVLAFEAGRQQAAGAEERLREALTKAGF